MGFWKDKLTQKLLGETGKVADKTYSTFTTIAEAIQDWIINNPKEAKWLRDNNCKIDSDVLKDEKYRDVRFDAGMPEGQTSCKVFDGKFFYTVGEYNDAVSKAYSPGGKYYEG